MATPGSSVFDDKYSIGILLLAALLFSWFLGLKNLALDWSSTADDTATPVSPNILMIVVDDLGYNDTTAINANGLHTPNLKQLADGGVTFRRHYADSTCTPSRVAILTGRYPERSGFRPVGVEIPAEFPTIAQRLASVGYATYLTGKWHAGEDRPEALPQNKGFEQWFGFLNQWETSGEVTNVNKGGVKKPTYIDPMLRKDGGPLVPHEGHLTDILTEHTLAKIKELESGKQPWFIYHAFLAPHHPIQPAQHYKDKFPNTPEGKYAALVTQLDDAVGRLVAAVDQQNTLILFVSDNGGTNKQRDNNFPFYGAKGEVFEGAYRTPLIINWPGKMPAGKFIDDIVMNVDIMPTLLSAANVPVLDQIDGQNLLPLIESNLPIVPRNRGWETYSANVNTLGFSFISANGEWRMTSPQGLPQALFDLSQEPAGKTDVAQQHPQLLKSLLTAFWQDHSEKSFFAPSQSAGRTQGQTTYSGFDAMRTPFRYGFAIGLEIGPLPDSVATATPSIAVLAGQAGFWQLRFHPGHGLEWEIGDTILRDTSFQPTQCNAVVLTGYFEPLAHLAKREPRSVVKLFSTGLLRDTQQKFDYSSIGGQELSTPTFVNFDGRAHFSNTVLSSFSENFEPRLLPDYIDLYKNLFTQRKLNMADIELMNSKLCKSPS